MVTKRGSITLGGVESYILAKNHMVTKQTGILLLISQRYILAKNHMVTKLRQAEKELEMSGPMSRKSTN